jgi:hypothetical protein
MADGESFAGVPSARLYRYLPLISSSTLIFILVALPNARQFQDAVISAF